MNRFELCRKQSYPSGADFNSGTWDLFISGYNLSNRIRLVYDQVQATEKIWVIAPDYAISENEMPAEAYVASDSRDEGEVIRQLLSSLKFSPGMKICLDATGFIRPHLLCLVRLLYERGVREFDVLYSEPEAYRNRERTHFSGGAIQDVRQVMGYEGESSERGRDLLIIGSGYDNRMIAKVAETKSACRSIQMFGFPPLRADMYQENLLRVSEAEDYTATTDATFAPANDPFVTAIVLKETIERVEKIAEIGNLYLSPLGTKAQVLGFALFYLAERLGTATSIIYPMSDVYSKDTTVGLSRVWKYSVEL